MLDKPMTRSETDSNALPGGRLTRRHETNYARQRDVRNVTYRRDGKFGDNIKGFCESTAMR